MNRQWLLQQVVCLIVVALLLAGCSGIQVEPTATPTSTPRFDDKGLNDKRVLFVIYSRFEESEYGIPRAILEDKGAVITVASSSSDVLAGHQGMEVKPDVVLNDVHAADYDAIVFIGGYGYNVDDPEAQRIAQEAVTEGKLLAAICIAPITLAKAGVVDGKRVTASAWFSELKEAGAIISATYIERDGLIITADGPIAAREFGEAIAAALDE